MQFLDGDCELNTEWLPRAVAALKTREEAAAVCGALLEREPERSIYNRICAIEWNGPVGEVATCGGNFVIRAESFRKVGGFNPTIIAAEDDDLCLRVRATGGKILRLDAPMAWHDAAMTRIGQWWKRAVRSGYAYAQVSAIHGRGPYRHFVREARSAWFWGVGVPVAIVALAFVTRGWALVLLPVLYFVAAFRITRNNRWRGLSPSMGWIYAGHCLGCKFPQVVGQVKFWWRRAASPQRDHRAQGTVRKLDEVSRYSRTDSVGMTGSVQVTSQTEPLFRARPANKPVRVGLVGTGYIAEFHARALRTIAGVELVAVADQNRLRAEAFARAWGIEGVFGSLAEMRTSGRLDAVHILTPPDTHADVAREALEADVHVLIEKPLDVEPDKARALCELAEQRGLALGVGHNFLFAEPYVRLREDVRAGRLGRLDSVAVTWNRELSFVTQGPYDVWMLRNPANIMLEVGVHSIAHVWDLLGASDEWHVDAANPKALPTGITFFRRWQARTEVEGTAAELNFSFIPGVTEHTIHVRGTFGTATADLEHNTYTLDRLTPYSTEFDRFVRVRRRGVGLAAQAGTNVCRHVLSKLKLSRSGNAYGTSIAASVAEFYHLVRDGRADGRIAPRFATDVVAAAETIGRVGVRAAPEQIVVPPQSRRPDPRAGRACSCWEAAASSGASWWHGCSARATMCACWPASRRLPCSTSPLRISRLWPATCGGPTTCDGRSTESNACTISPVRQPKPGKSTRSRMST